ncbi:hypothetical protein ACHWQZ_G012163 [Mnemiopsis leidyi]
MLMTDPWCGAFLICCSVFSVVGNLATLSVIILRKSLRTVSNCLIGHLAFVDFLIGGPIVISNSISALGGVWPGGEMWCRIHGYLSIVTNVVAYILLTFIALDAFVLIHFPFRYRGSITIRKANAMMFVTWLLLGGLCVPITALNKTLYAPFLFTCVVITEPNKMNNSISIAQYVYRGTLFLVMVLCYASIVRTTQKHLKTCRNYSLPDTPGSVDRVQGVKSAKQDRKKLSSNKPTAGRRIMPNKYATKAAGTMFIILIVFLGAWLPTSLLDIVYQICTKYGVSIMPSYKMLLILNNLHFLPSAINPILYAARQQHIRYEFFQRSSGVLGRFFRQKQRGDQWPSTSTKAQQIHQLYFKKNNDARDPGSVVLS